MLRPGAVVKCGRCRTQLERTTGRSLDAALACAAATFVFLLPANLAPIMSVEVLGAERATRLGSGVLSMWREGWVITAILTGLFGVVLPPLRFGAL